MPPPELAGDAPVADVAHPLEIFRTPVFRDDADFAALDGRDRGFRQRFHFHEPLVREARLDVGLAAVAGADGIDVVFDALHQAQRGQVLDHFLAGDEAIQAGVLPGGRAHARVVGHHVDLFQAMTLAGFEVVGVVRGGELHYAASEFAVHETVRDDGNFAIHQRQQNFAPHQARVALIVRVHGHARIPQHCFRARGRHHHVFRCADDGVAQVPQFAVALLVNRFQVADRRQAARAPVDNVPPAINQAVFMEAHKNFADRAGEPGVHGEALARPVAALAERDHLARDRAAGFRLPLPDFLLELLAAQVAVVDAFFGQLPYHHALGGDAGVVGAGQVERVVAAHAVPAREDVDLGVIEHMPDMQRAGDVGRRDDNGKHFTGRARIGAIQPFVVPGLRPALLDFLRLVSLGDLSRHNLRESSAIRDKPESIGGAADGVKFGAPFVRGASRYSLSISRRIRASIRGRTSSRLNFSIV